MARINYITYDIWQSICVGSKTNHILIVIGFLIQTEEIEQLKFLFGIFWISEISENGGILASCPHGMIRFFCDTLFHNINII